MYPSIPLLGYSRSPVIHIAAVNRYCQHRHVSNALLRWNKGFTNKRLLSQKLQPNHHHQRCYSLTTAVLYSNLGHRPQFSKKQSMSPLTLLGGIRQHAGHHHHHDGDIVTSLKSSSKRGTRITIIGLASNVGLTVTKGIAGWVMNSASLLAEALHSFSDLLSDFVTLYTFKMSRKPADDIYPYGYGKFETVGSVTVSSLLLAGAVTIGWHSFDLLITALQTSGFLLSDASAAASTAIENAASNPTTTSNIAQSHHGHGHGGVLDPNAAWFALASVIIKEWLYRATVKVGIAERSEVLMANAWHHRSDAYSSGVALVAIVGSYAGLPVLDPIGGIIVSGMLVKSSVGLLCSSMKELMDKGMSAEQILSVKSSISEIKDRETDLVDFHSVRGRKQGPFNHVDLVLRLNPNISMQSADQIREMVRSNVKNNCDNIQDVMIYLEDASTVKNDQYHDHDDHCHHDHEDDHVHNENKQHGDTTSVKTHHH